MESENIGMRLFYTLHAAFWPLSSLYLDTRYIPSCARQLGGSMKHVHLLQGPDPRLGTGSQEREC